MLRGLRGYSAFVSRNPLRGNALSMGVVVGAGDVLAQALAGAPFDTERTATTAAYGLACGPPFRMWLLLLERVAVLRPPTLRNAVLKTLINQCVWSPLFNSTYFALVIVRQAWLHPIDGASPSANSLLSSWIHKCRLDLLSTLLVGNLWFFPANTAIFRFVPLDLRVVANAAAVACWNVYLSTIGHRNLPATRAQRQARV